VKVCAFDAIKVENGVAYIDSQKCKLCRKCVNECPTGAIVLRGMDPLPKEPKTPAAKSAAPATESVSKPAVEQKNESVNEQK
jgi:Fe-S-cluster-containing hydrogenase component 2